MLAQVRGGGAGMFIACSRRRVDEVPELQSDGIRVGPYHAGLDAAARREVKSPSISRRRPVIVATIAFGMGINKPTVRWVAHYDLPRLWKATIRSPAAPAATEIRRAAPFIRGLRHRTSEFLIQQKIDHDGRALEEEQRIARQQLRQVMN